MKWDHAIREGWCPGDEFRVNEPGRPGREVPCHGPSTRRIGQPASEWEPEICPSSRPLRSGGLAGGSAMNDETRKLLKIFGVAVTDFEAEAEKLAATAAQLSADSSRDQVATLMKDAAELGRELNTRWLEVTQHIFALQNRFLSRCAVAAATVQGL